MPAAPQTRFSWPPRTRARRVAVVLLLALWPLAPAAAQDRAPDGRRPGAIPVNPDAPALLGRVAPERARRPVGRRHLPHPVPVVPVVPAFGVGQRGARPAATASEDTGPGGEGSEARAGAESRGAAASADTARPGPRGPCLELAVRMAAGGVHRLRVDGGTLGVGAPRELAALLRERMASEGALAVRGMDGVSLHLPADRVAGLRAERCPGLRVR